MLDTMNQQETIDRNNNESWCFCFWAQNRNKTPTQNKQQSFWHMQKISHFPWTQNLKQRQPETKKEGLGKVGSAPQPKPSKTTPTPQKTTGQITETKQQKQSNRN